MGLNRVFVVEDFFFIIIFLCFVFQIEGLEVNEYNLVVFKQFLVFKEDYVENFQVKKKVFKYNGEENELIFIEEVKVKRLKVEEFFL